MPIINFSLINILNLFIASILNIMFYVIILKKTYKINIIKNNKKIIITLLLFGLFLLIINLYNKSAFKPLLTFPITTYAIKKLFELDLKKSIVYTLIANLYGFLGEILMSIILTFLPINYLFVYQSILGTLFGSISVIILSLPFLFSKFFQKFIIHISDFLLDKEKKWSKIVIVILLIISALNYKMIISTANFITSIMNIIITISIIFILYRFYSEYEKSQVLSNEYNNLIKYLEKYEKEVNAKRKIIHDFKNQLIIINGYIEKDKELKKYVTELIKEQKNINECEKIKEIDKVPKGLKGLIYYKLSQLDKNVIINLKIFGHVNNFTKLSPKINKNILKMVGIILDNAIEAIQKEHEKYINIELIDTQKNLKINIKNGCSKIVDNKKIMTPGYSTKGKNRGYGLAIIKDILEQEQNITLEMICQNNEFISEITILK